MIMLVVASVIALGRGGAVQLSSNWSDRHTGLSTSIVRQIFDGVCIGMLGLTGFECEFFYQKPTAQRLILRRCTRLYSKAERKSLPQSSSQLAFVHTRAK